jgi:hypothetical protein
MGSIIDSLIIQKPNYKLIEQKNEDFLNHMNRLKDMNAATPKMTTQLAMAVFFRRKEGYQGKVWAGLGWAGLAALL